MELLNKNRQKNLIILVSLTLIILAIMPTMVNSQDLNQIRVQLLSGKSDYESSTTLCGSTGLKITTNSSIPFVYETSSNEIISIEFDSYRLLLLETSSISEATNIINQVKNNKEIDLCPSVEIINKNNIEYYRVILGNFTNINELNEAKQIISSKTGINSKVIGDLHWSFGNFTSVGEANIKANEINTKGFNSYVVQVFNNNTWEYQVWIGDSNNTTEFQAIKTSVEQSFPGISLVQAGNLPYVINKTIGFINNGILTKNKLLSFSSLSIVNISSKTDSSYIEVCERNYKDKVLKYRGNLSVQIYNDEIAIVNQLALEEYLYAVVGSEMYTSWPIEALKAQAVAARTFAYQKILSPRNSIADIYDTVSDQAYFGVNEETESIKQAVNTTKGVVITKNNSPITAFYSSNAGGTTSHGTEVWGSNISYTTVKDSPYDEVALENVMDWYRIIRDNGDVGYIRSDMINFSAKMHFLGFNYGYLNDNDVNMRTAPSIYYSKVITTLPKGEEIVILDTVKENNSYSWIAGPISAETIIETANEFQLKSADKFTQPILDLNIVNRGPSGRVLLLADGTNIIPVSYPDTYRNLLGGLSEGIQSSQFEIEQSGTVEILGANGVTKTTKNMKNQIYVQSADGTKVLTQVNNNQDEYFILSGNNEIRVATKDQNYVFTGNGLGHGIGMSQWGAKGMADAGNTYQDIVGYYYENVQLKQIY